ncbi:BamA/TamA family outer membrane protein [candidate division KSB1 bacterium]|nr:BamA/TamA family outer membrane protein [candidate division KSB1 bacterium]NIR68359.1 BamA/TamA family outer membrane protein [candidate division KSB1 bacterium]NIS22544.1 BamA/TamA family outer membrane protein [candidate division KSB1 bacterium]NIT69380.1 BamA/TamA family outer membrane protein [candidate division KSB1 bacterium]NIU23041.1 BamA/TamA family outer membrane protein [candidate division KSB1 bacterium]
MHYVVPSKTFFHRVVSLFLLIWFSNASGQTFQKLPDSTSTRQPKKILAVIVQGNEKTKEKIILREMKLKVGDQFDQLQAERDRLRIQNLGIFNRVEMDMVPTNHGVILVVTVSEMWYIFPYPIIFRNERDWDRISIGAGVLHNNFRGHREVIDFSFWLGFNPSVRLRYTNPWIFGKLKFYTSVSVFARKVRNLTFTAIDSSVNENQIGFNWRIGKRFGHFTYLDLNLGYKQLTFSEDVTGQTLSTSGKDRLPHVGFSFTYDKRDLWEYPHSGHYINIWARKTGWFGNTVDYLRYGADVRKYVPIGPTTLAFRGATNLSAGTIPVYDQVHFGFSTRIRGHFSERHSGENRLIGSAAFRFPIRKISYHDFGPFQSMGRYGSNFRFGVSGALFVDTGAVWGQNSGFGRDDTLELDDFISGWGAGLHFFLPYMNILRLEYGFNENWDGQFIVDLFAFF